MLALFTTALVALILLNVPGERPLLVEPNTAPGEPEVVPPSLVPEWARP
jgi:hypothetical protein